MAALIASTRNPALSASVVSKRELFYSAGADAASPCAGWFCGRIAVIQDDAAHRPDRP